VLSAFFPRFFGEELCMISSRHGGHVQQRRVVNNSAMLSSPIAVS